MPPEHMPYAVKPVAVFVRPFTAGASGADVRAVKRALLASGHGQGEDVATASFGAAAVADLKVFQTLHKLPATGDYDAATHRALTPFFDQYGHALLSKEAVALAKKIAPAAPPAAPAKAPDLRAAYVKALAWGVAHHDQFSYFETRPMPMAATPFGGEHLNTDCSGWVTIAAKWAGCPDPNGLGFNGEGYTGTILAHCEHVSIDGCLPGDLIVYGPGPGGFHVSAAVEKQGGDWNTVSNGHQGAPNFQSHSGMAQWMGAHGHPGFTVCRFLPVAG